MDEIDLTQKSVFKRKFFKDLKKIQTLEQTIPSQKKEIEVKIFNALEKAIRKEVPEKWSELLEWSQDTAHPTGGSINYFYLEEFLRVNKTFDFKKTITPKMLMLVWHEHGEKFKTNETLKISTIGVTVKIIAKNFTEESGYELLVAIY